jgi:hypothetical protein
MEHKDSRTMLDALAAEAKEIMDLQAEASRISIEATRKAGLLWKQIDTMAGADVGQIIDIDYGQQKRDGVLNSYAQSDKTPGDIGDDFDLHWRQVDRMIRRARKEGDPRAAQGDLLRQPVEMEVLPTPPSPPAARPTPDIHKQPPYVAAGPKREARAKPTLPAISEAPVEATVPAVVEKLPVPGMPLCELDLKDCWLTFGDHRIKLARTELRIVHFLNDQEPKSLDRVLKHMNLISKRSLERETRHLIPRLQEIGLVIKELPGSEYHLQTYPSA